jgi:hypothetical protein
MLEAKGDDKLIPFVTHGDFAEPRSLSEKTHVDGVRKQEI